MKKGSSVSIYKQLGATNHCGEDRADDDFYATPPIAIDRLLKAESPSPVVWECACGGGHLSQRLKELGFTVHSTDLRDRGYEGQEGTMDFLACGEMPWKDADILTNPPYCYAEKFVLHALDLLEKGHRLFLLLKIQFLETRSRYENIFRRCPPRSVYVCKERLACARNGDFAHQPSSAVCYCWYVWEKGFEGKPTIGWI